MVRKILLLICLFTISLPVLADELLDKLNSTPASQFSGFTNTARPKYPSLYRAKSVVDMQYEDDEKEMEQGDVVSVKKILKENPGVVKSAPMTYSSFPQNYDSSNSMMMMNGGMQGMFNQIGY